ncbi:type I secretion system permease/ATPase [Vibrio splendidus]|jgi:ATP-binding cassette subfamily B protein RtxE|uniref:Toxin RTX-I translocation ATP-binding protein n=1 Tax=Vibrio syngnathi TaxID=3034029 RepID=A0AA34TSN6_9VIBR|nr:MULTISPECIES: type I secretion system permease/ATPase [Vibrio]ARP39778.1 Toxin RTX-I translocation ATP-binding protein [Vibrio syngnathi]MCC4859148.1 type I secretion system permease/ATPase [Vibrio splendidus]MDH5937767.1 type I secretion system permease/ATPase [Vibrio splendidus]PTO56902.1 type I secretion system permease/ATPase [Vibrio splendidus]PTO80083.1 type I secretion system permease/ATPase [Vibrio splendidus]
MDMTLSTTQDVPIAQDTSCTQDTSSNQDISATKDNGGIDAVVYAGNHFHKKSTKTQLKHALGVNHSNLSDMQIREAADYIGLKSQVTKVKSNELDTLPLPVLIEIDNSWKVLTKSADGSSLLYDPTTQLDQQSELSLSSQLSMYKVMLVADERLSNKEVKFGLSWFAPSIWRQKSQMRDVFFYAIALQIFALVSPLLFQNVIDKVLVGRSLSSLHVLAMAMLALAIAEPAYSYLRNTVFGHLASQVNAELSGRLYRHLVGLPLTYFKQRQTGQIIARVREMAQIRQFLTGSTLMLVLDLIFVAVFIAVMFHYASTLTWLVIGSLIIYFLLWLIAGPLIRKKVESEYESDADATTFLTEAVTGIETIKTTATEHRFLHQWQRILSQQLKRSFDAQKSGLIAGQSIALIQKLTAALLLWWGVSAVLNGELTPGELVAFNMLAGHVTQPVLRLAQIWQDFQHTLIALKRVGDILDEPKENSKQGLASVPELNGGIEFHNIRFRYHEDAPEVLANLSLEIKPGQFIGITGPSGSGKSTITRLLQRLYVPQHGQVLVDGMDLAIADPISLRRNMSVVLQDSILFSGSVADNIRLSKPQASDEEMRHAAQLAGALEFIEELPHGFDQPVGEKGSSLSGGQRQRVALARALLVNPRILLLDEATSALDYNSEAAIMSNMDEICRGRTVISIAHRLNTLRHADNILVLDKGQVCENGTHDELVEKEGLYAKLWKQQIG